MTRCNHTQGSFKVRSYTDPETVQRQYYVSRKCAACGEASGVDVTPDAPRWGFSQEEWENWWEKVCEN
jgi:hypothetical protein